MSAQSEITRFVQFYNSELARTGFKPDQTSTRETRITFLQATVKRFCSSLLAMKRADPGRPISDEVVVFVGPGFEYRLFADFLISGGSSAWRLSDHIEGELPIQQPLVNPITLELLPEHTPAPTVPGCNGTPITPQPPMPTQPPGREEALDELNWLDAYYAAPEGLQRPNGLSLNGKPDFEGIAAWYLDVYQRERMAMKSRADARAAYVNDIRHSAEWQAKHPGETP